MSVRDDSEKITIAGEVYTRIDCEDQESLTCTSTEQYGWRGLYESGGHTYLITHLFTDDLQTRFSDAMEAYAAASWRQSPFWNHSRHDIDKFVDYCIEGEKDEDGCNKFEPFDARLYEYSGDMVIEQYDPDFHDPNFHGSELDECDE